MGCASLGLVGLHMVEQCEEKIQYTCKGERGQWGLAGRRKDSGTELLSGPGKGDSAPSTSVGRGVFQGPLGYS